MGRPSKLLQVVRVDDGREITAGQHVVELVALGLEQKSACGQSGIAVSTLHEWKQRGAKALALLSQGKPVEPRDIPFADWLADLERAQQAAELRYLTVIDAAATQPQRITKVTIRKERQPLADGTGFEMVEVERTEVIESRPPLWTAAAWRLERGVATRGRYTRRFEIEEVGAGRSQEETAHELAANLRAYLVGIADAEAQGPLHGPDVIDVDSIEG